MIRVAHLENIMAFSQREALRQEVKEQANWIVESQKAEARRLQSDELRRERMAAEVERLLAIEIPDALPIEEILRGIVLECHHL